MATATAPPMVAPPMLAPPMATAMATPIPDAGLTRLATALLPPLLAADSGENTAPSALGYNYNYICSDTVTDSATARATDRSAVLAIFRLDWGDGLSLLVVSR